MGVDIIVLIHEDSLADKLLCKYTTKYKDIPKLIELVDSFDGKRCYILENELKLLFNNERISWRLDSYKIKELCFKAFTERYVEKWIKSVKEKWLNIKDEEGDEEYAKEYENELITALRSFGELLKLTKMFDIYNYHQIEPTKDLHHLSLLLFYTVPE
jgi:hypothetical protein